ncbi:hypothetical protein MSAN_00352800 [Mycena sanguinolenta]|uniref:Uncharacterized protein n=1 Tax=Mycena sanguinolenta TaxID=230812 RepID=A0A8H6Z995_9AGAR|nr:hypothetical protein MSAN_00352800 [Mycena sanguinolenta]
MSPTPFLFNSTQPKLSEPKSSVWLKRIRAREEDASANQPPPKRQRQVMTCAPAYRTGLNNILWANDTTTIAEIQSELESFDWALHDSLNVPVCKDWDWEEDEEEEEDGDKDEERSQDSRRPCEICKNYIEHVLERAGQDDDAVLSESGEGSRYEGNGRKKSATDEKDAGNEDGDDQPFKSELMCLLFHLRDRKAREAAFAYDHTDPRSMGQLQGLLVSFHVDKLQAEAQRDHARADRHTAETQRDDALAAETRAKAELLQLECSAKELQTQLQQALAEIASLKDALHISKLKSDRQHVVAEKTAGGSVAENSAENLSARVSTQPTELSIKMPGKDAPPEVFAKWLQYRKLTNIKGIRLCGPDWVVDLRDVRGYVQVQYRIPPKGPSKGDRLYSNHCLLAILWILAIPRKYDRMLNSMGLKIAEIAQIEPLPIPFDNRLFDDEKTTRLLAGQGLTTAVANDTWQFCRNLVFDLALSENSIASEASSIKSAVEAELVDTTPPCGLRPAEEDQYRPVGAG